MKKRIYEKRTYIQEETDEEIDAYYDLEGNPVKFVGRAAFADKKNRSYPFIFDIGATTLEEAFEKHDEYALEVVNKLKETLKEDSEKKQESSEAEKKVEEMKKRMLDFSKVGLSSGLTGVNNGSCFNPVNK